MVDSISTNPGNAAKASSPVPMQPIAKTPETAAPAPAPKASAPDSVEISASAQVKSLQKQGQNAAEIALQLGMDPARVALYLGEK